MRHHYFDNGKALASFLGFVYHSALVFTDSDWLINIPHPDSLTGLQVYTEYINLFRMPLFLFISGYFAAYSVSKYSLKDFTVLKLTRLGLPLISTLITFNIIERIYVYKFDNKDYSSLLPALLPWSPHFQLLSHLWFVYYILMFSFVLYICSFPIKKYCSSNPVNRLGKYADAAFLACSFGFLGFCGILYIATGFLHELFSFLTIGKNLPYFVLGVLTFLNWDALKDKFLNLSKARFIVIFLLLVISYILTAQINDILPNYKILFNTFPRYFSLVLILGLLYRFLNRSNRILKYMSESSYSVYLLHQPVIVVTGYYYINYFYIQNSILGYLFVLLLSAMVVYTLDYLLIRKTRLGKFLFTGRLVSERKQVANVQLKLH